jgi:uncharacterized membrane protein
MHTPIFDILLVVIGLLGFALCTYMYRCKSKKKPLVCPLRTSCDFVTTSKYSKFLGIHLEIIGMVYYGVVVVIHAIVAIDPVLATTNGIIVGLVASIGAFLFSIYLTSIQAFVLRQWCTWCLCSATLCLLIFITTYFSSPIKLF